MYIETRIVPIVPIIDIPIADRFTTKLYPQVPPGYLYHPGEMLENISSQKAWPLYRSLMNRPPSIKMGNMRIVTRPEKVRWWIRCKLVKLGVI